MPKSIRKHIINQMKTEFRAISENERLSRAMICAMIAQMDVTVEELADVRCAISEAVTKLLRKPLLKLGSLLGINDTAAAGLVASLANSIATFGMVKDMDNRGKVVNIAFAVSAAFVFGDHLGFTAGFAPEMLPGVIVGKLVGGVSAVAVALWLTRKK